LIVLLGVMASCPVRAEVDEATMRKASQDFLKAVIADILKDPATAAYFPGVTMKDVTLYDGKGAPGAVGWLYSWGYRHAVHDGPLELGLQRPPPVFENDRAIRFSVFVAYDHGDAMVSRRENYTVTPELHVGMDFGMLDEKNLLFGKLDGIVRTHLTELKTAVGSPRSRIAFERDDAVWVANADGTSAKKIGRGQCPDLSPDGTKLVFNTLQPDGQPAHRQIAVADLGTGDITILKDIPSTNCLEPQFSRDGRQILFTFYKDNESYIGLVNMDGRDFRYVTNAKPKPPAYWAIAWAADGKSLFAEDMESLYRLDLSGQVLKKWPVAALIPNGEMSGDARFDASPDGKTLLMSIEMNEKERKGWDGPPPALWVLDLTTEKATRLTPPGLYAWDAHWLEAPVSLLFITQNPGEEHTSIYRMSATGQGKDKKLLIKNARYPGAAR